ncbi:MAG TPA: histidine phosphatase family protein [Verrucomicrobiota bacterium]|jgi:broad specificity phosphatase PhoE|nr:histidine phosphatase family protein [Verrucomicrobiota bacterium]HQL80170.1 histidine phosphatase family protein [Verrucomicrobiota bacterium]
MPSVPPATRLLLVRHAEVEASYQGVFGGRLDMELSPRGHEQAVALAAYLHRQPLDAIYASPMKRVQQTLSPLLVNGTPRPVILPDLREVDFGDWTGLAYDAVHARFGVSAVSWLEQLECDGIANAECSETLQDRVEPCLRQILDRHPGQQVAIFCHGGIIRVLLAILLRWPLPRLGAFAIGYASVTRVRLRPERAELQLVNYTPWRDADGWLGSKVNGCPRG